MIFLPITILIVIIILKLIIERKNRTYKSLFYTIFLLVFLLSLAIGSDAVIILSLFLPILAWPVYSCWIKPDKRMIWRSLSVISLIVALAFSKFYDFGLGFNNFVSVFFFQIGSALGIMLPISVASFVDWRMRYKIKVQNKD